jgi:hypothetical protein
VLPDEARRELRNIRDQIGPWSETLTQSLHQLDELPNATLVQVEDGDTLIELAKKNGHIVVQVHEPGTRVHVRLPTRSLRLAGSFLAS